MRDWLLHNLGLKIVALVLAVLLWMVVVGEQKVEVQVDVPITLAVPSNLFLVNTPPDTAQVRLRGPKGLVSSLRSREIRPTSVPGPLVAGDNVITLREDLIDVPRGIQVVDVTPRRIRVVLEPATEREVEVTPRLEGTLAEGLVLRRVTALPARVRVVGPAGEVRRITRVQTMPVSVAGQRASFTAQTELEPLGPRIRPQGGDSVTVEVEIGAKRS